MNQGSAYFRAWQDTGNSFWNIKQQPGNRNKALGVTSTLNTEALNFIEDIRGIYGDDTDTYSGLYRICFSPGACNFEKPVGERFRDGNLLMDPILRYV